MLDSRSVEAICKRVSEGENIVQIITSMNLPIMETLEVLGNYEGEIMAAQKKIKRIGRFTHTIYA